MFWIAKFIKEIIKITTMNLICSLNIRLSTNHFWTEFLTTHRGNNFSPDIAHIWSYFLNESMNQWINESMNQWMNQWINESMNQWINQSINQSIKQSIKQSMNQWINQSINRSIKQTTIQPSNQLTNQSIKKAELVNAYNNRVLFKCFAHPHSLPSGHSSERTERSQCSHGFEGTHPFQTHTLHYQSRYRYLKQNDEWSCSGR